MPDALNSTQPLPAAKVSGDTTVTGTMRGGATFSIQELRGHPWHTIVTKPGDAPRGRLSTPVEVALAQIMIGGRHVR